MAVPPLPNLLFFSPVFPGTTGNGLAMRAGAMLEALSSRYAVYLVAPGDSEAVQPAGCESWFRIPRLRHRKPLLWLGNGSTPPPEWGEPSETLLQQLHAWIEGVSVSHVHVFRLYMLPLAQSVWHTLPGPPARLHLDFDDIESDARLAMAQCSATFLERRIQRNAARFYARKEAEMLPECDGVYVCSTPDKDLLRQRGIREVHVVPNIIRSGAFKLLPDPPDPFTFLFVGNLNHLPNVDGLEYLVGELLPRLRTSAPAPFRIVVAGSGGLSPRLDAIRSTPEIEWVGAVDTIETVYHLAHATLVPLRCGGGTRIKILESFSLGRPVVSTPAGARGLDVKTGEELLIPPDADSFAQACIDLMKSSALRNHLATRAGTWVRRYASMDFLRDAVFRAMKTEETT